MIFVWTIPHVLSPFLRRFCYYDNKKWRTIKENYTPMNIYNGTRPKKGRVLIIDLSVTVALKSLVGQPSVVPFLTCEIFKGVKWFWRNPKGEGRGHERSGQWPLLYSRSLTRQYSLVPFGRGR